MKIVEKMAEKSKNIMDSSGVTIACLGPSTTQGCFEVYRDENGNIETVFEQENAFHAHLKTILSTMYPKTPINIINAGISGDGAEHGLKRIERDVLRYNPDLVIVSFGGNDIWGGEKELNIFKESLKQIFRVLKERDIEVIFLTGCMKNTYVSSSITDVELRELAGKIAKKQLDGTVDKVYKLSLEACEEEGVVVCDEYAKWKMMHKNGVDVTALLANKLNHPNRKMTWLTAMLLADTIMSD